MSGCWKQRIIRRQSTRKEGSFAGKANGEHAVWLDDQLVVDRQDVIFRLKSDVLVERFTGRNFFGGSNDLFRPRKLEYVWCCPPAARHAYLFLWH